MTPGAQKKKKGKGKKRKDYGLDTSIMSGQKTKFGHY